MNLTLIGMSGAGKSYVGRHVAERLQLAFLDIDAEIEKNEGKTLPKIIADIGDEAFIELESRTTITTTEDKDGLLISTGGSIIYAPDAIAHLKAISKVLYLRAPLDVIEGRVGKSADRIGRIVRLGSRTLRELYDERVPLYERTADAALDVSSGNLEDAVEAVVSFTQGR